MFLVDKLWPFVSKRVSSERDAGIKRDIQEREWQHEMEQRHVTALEQIAKVIPEFSTRLAAVEGDVKVIRDATTVLVERKATVVTTTIPTP